MSRTSILVTKCMDLDTAIALLALVLFIWIAFHYKPETTLRELFGFLGSAFIAYRVVTPTVWEKQRRQQRS